MIVLSKRLQSVADMASPGGGAVDIGTDHAYVPIYLAEKGLKERLAACDVVRGPLDIAETNIKKYGFEGQIDTCLSDGLERVAVSADDSVIIAGMGGLLIRDILSRQPHKARTAKELILQPQSEIGELRRFLTASDFVITDEDAVFEDGKFYFVIKASYSDTGVPDLSEAEAEFGPVLLKDAHPVLKDYICRGIKVDKEIIDHLSADHPGMNAITRMEQLKDHISFMERIIREYYEMQ